MASGDAGNSFINSKIYPSKEANYKLDPGAGISAPNLAALIRRMRGREIYDGPDTKIDVEWTPIDKRVKKGKVYDAGTVAKARVASLNLGDEVEKEKGKK